MVNNTMMANTHTLNRYRYRSGMPFTSTGLSAIAMNG